MVVWLYDSWWVAGRDVTVRNPNVSRFRIPTPLLIAVASTAVALLLLLCCCSVGVLCAGFCPGCGAVQQLIHLPSCCCCSGAAVFVSYALVSVTDAVLYSNPEKVTPAVAEHLKAH
jgi:hypothetical protein